MIRKILCFLLFSSACCFSLMAQWSAGLSGGATLNFLEWKIQPLQVDLAFDPHLGWRTAGHLEYAFSPAAALRADMAYQVIGSNLSDLTDENGEVINGKFVNTYHTVGGSLLLKISPVKRVQNLYLLAGPTVAQIIRGHKQLKVKFPGQVENRDKQKIDLDADKIRRTHWIADLGIGYGIACGARGRIAAECRYQYGLSDFSTSEQVKARMQTVLLTAGYFYSL